EIVPDLVVEDLRDRVSDFGRIRGLVGRLAGDRKLVPFAMVVPGKPDQALGYVFDRNDKVDKAGRDGGFRHAALPRCGPVAALCDGQAAALLDRLDAERAIAAAPRQHDADRVLAFRFSERAEEDIDRLARHLAGPALQEELAIVDGDDIV